LFALVTLSVLHLSTAVNNIMSTLINLNVGGTSFTTTMATLCSDQNSVLASMFDPEKTPAIKDLSGAYFIDRDPKAFSVLLNFLRTGQIFTMQTGVSSAQLEVEATHFGLTGILKAMEVEKLEREAVRMNFQERRPDPVSGDKRRLMIYYKSNG
jgi:hypothetical protein